MAKYDYPFDPEAANNTAAAIYALARTGGATVLDVGSGPGIVARALVHADGKHVACLDLDAGALEDAAAAGVPETHVVDADAVDWFAPVGGRRFDTIVLADVLEHLVAPERLLRDIGEQGLLADEGQLVISIPNAAHESVIAELIAGRFDYTETGLLDRTHIRWFTRESLTAMLEAAGFLVVEVHRTLRTLEQTVQARRAVQVPEGARAVLAGLGLDHRTFQYVLRVRPSTAAGQLASARADIEAAAQALHESRGESSRLRGEADGLRAEVTEAQRELAGVQALLDEERARALQGPVAGEVQERELEDLRDEVAALRRSLRQTQDKLASTQEWLERLRGSRAVRVARAVRTLERPMSAARRAVARDRAPSRPGGSKEPAPAARRLLAAAVEGRRAARDVEAEYRAIVRGDRAQGPAGLVVFCVYTDDLDEGRGDVFVAAGLARALSGLGHGVLTVPRAQWSRLPPEAAVVVAMLPGFDPSTVPDGTPVLAWVRNETDEWLLHPRLALFDAVMASSRLSQEALQERFAGPSALLPLAVDPDLFGPPGEAEPARPPRERLIVSTVNSWGRERAAHTALAAMSGDADLVLFGASRGLPAALRKRAAGPVSYFAIPEVYKRALVVLDDLNHTTLPYGNVNSRVFESLGSGALPVTNSRLGLGDLGLDDVPAYRSPDELLALVESLRQDPAATRRRARELREVVLRDHTYSRRAEALVALFGRLGERPPRRTVGFTPDYTAENPYQDLLYTSVRGSGARVVPVADPLSSVVPRDPGGRLDGYVFHVHWTAPLVQPATSTTAALRRLEAVKRNVDDLLARGGHLVWTVHNVLPHECRYRAQEIELCRYLAARADVVHVMGPETHAAVAPLYELPAERTRIVRHSSYVGVYPDMVSRQEARRRLGVLPSEVALLALGGVRPYKGLDRLLDVFDDAVREDPRLRLLIAGKPGRFAELEAWRRRCERHPRITARFAFVPDAELQVWARAADAAVLPYPGILNSGAFQLALTFGLPVVAPRDGALAALLDPAYTVGFTPGDRHSLGGALRQVRHLLTPEAARAARKAAEAYPPQAMARDFAAVLDEVWDPTHPPAS